MIGLLIGWLLEPLDEAEHSAGVAFTLLVLLPSHLDEHAMFRN